MVRVSWFSLAVGAAWVGGGLFFILVPRSRWYARRLEDVFGERAAEVRAERVRWYALIGYLCLLLGLFRIVTA
ncbi:MAG: hypothetical protein IMW98_05635 [Firmicutes bacterium]|nr:hypothetical protein [Bacillota bacterium]